jgi:DNA helicase-2/ATP-dependent DNA helicase PcrA
VNRPSGELTPRALAAALGLPVPTDEQAAVVAAPAEPALVVAGAGAGKTETMAARVVWLVATGRVLPEQVLGLTFTRKAAQQLADRVRSRLRRLAGSALLDELDPSGLRRAAVLAGEPTVLTYHAYAGRLVAEHALRLPAEPGARLLTETAAWQLAHRVVATWSSDLDVDLVPATVTQRVLALAGQLGEHLVDPDALVAAAAEFREIVESAPRSKGQRAELPQKYRRMLDIQRQRVALLPLVAAFTERKRAERVIDFSDQMAIAALIADGHPAVGELERQRYTAVLLDEYQDTGHAQRVLLRALFGSGTVPVMAVGDPHQSIYGWRGASAANLPRFRTDFPGPEGRPALRYGLLTSFRNTPRVLALANVASAPLRTAAVAVEELRPAGGGRAGEVRLALTSDVLAELDWVADAVARRWHSGGEGPASIAASGASEERNRSGPDHQNLALDADGPAPSAAVLVRRRADMAGLAGALRARQVPVEVVGLGGLLDEPEVRDLVSALRLVADPTAGTAAVRLLTGARWRLGVADLAALWRRARRLAATRSGVADRGSLDAVLPGERAEQAALVDALDDPGPAEDYSAAGYARIDRLSGELAGLRRRVSWVGGGGTLPDLVADAERMLLLDAETVARPGPAGRAHLDAFADVVAEFAAGAEVASLPALLDYLDTAEDAEDGFAPGEVEVASDRVQILTVHAAKGLEWDLVAVPHLVHDVFPARRQSGEWLTNPTELPVALRGDEVDLPRLRLPVGGDRREVIDAIDAHTAALEERRQAEERRLLYVALTRARDTLLVSGHWWGATAVKPCGPSTLLTELHDACEDGAGVIEQWADEPPDGESNPVTADPATARWPVDPLGSRRDGVQRGAALVRDALASPAHAELTLNIGLGPGGDPEGWAADTEVLLAERAAASSRRGSVELPEQLSVSQLVELAADPAALAARLRRPVPFPPNPHARRGTAFHAWLEHRFGATRLLDLDELPGAADDGAADDRELAELQRAFLASAWAERRPLEVEVPFETQVDGIGLRGRMDAVFADADGGYTVVDWKTGALPDPDRLPTLAVQLAAYRLAWAALCPAPLERVRAAFHYVRHDHTEHPADLLDADGLRALLRSVPVRTGP